MRTSNPTPDPSLTVPQLLLLRVRSVHWEIIFAGMVLLIVAFLSVRTAPVLATKPVGAETGPLVQGQGLRLTPAGDRIMALGRLRPRAPEDLIDALRRAPTAGDRLVAMSALEQMGDTAMPALIAGLASPDPALRVASSQVLGWRRAASSVAPLVSATFDSQSVVREAAVCALGEIGDLQALQRIQQLKATEGNYYVQQAAYLAEQRIDALVATELGIGSSELHAAAVATTGDPAYVLTSKGVYAKKAGRWSLLANLPFELAELVATDTGGQVVFVSSAQGLYRSTDAGHTWEPVHGRLATAPAARITALTVNPRNSRHIFVALADLSGRESAAGIYASEDGGDTWYLLPSAPSDYVTNSLSLDPASGKYLYGVTGIGVWRYVMPSSGAHSGTN